MAISAARETTAASRGFRKSAAWSCVSAAVRSGKFLPPILREFYCSPFRPFVLNSHWLSWNDGTARKMAQAIYDDRAFDRLPLLADALEDAGCTDAAILDHCRSVGEHVRG